MVTFFEMLGSGVDSLIVPFVAKAMMLPLIKLADWTACRSEPGPESSRFKTV
jgi:hypothetical protein